jgi:hypothetical protein
MDETSILKEYHLWSDSNLLEKNTVLNIPKKSMAFENQYYDSINEVYMETPLMYCHIVDLEIIENNDTDFITCKVIKIRDLSY